jgi:hypothetical protein
MSNPNDDDYYDEFLGIPHHVAAKLGTGCMIAAVLWGAVLIYYCIFAR